MTSNLLRPSPHSVIIRFPFMFNQIHVAFVMRMHHWTSLNLRSSKRMHFNIARIRFKHTFSSQSVEPIQREVLLQSPLIFNTRVASICVRNVLDAIESFYIGVKKNSSFSIYKVSIEVACSFKRWKSKICTMVANAASVCLGLFPLRAPI